MGDSKVEGMTDHRHRVLERVTPAEVVPQPERNRRQLEPPLRPQRLYALEEYRDAEGA